MLYVTDAARGVVSILQTDEMRVIRTNKVHFGSPGGGETSATVDPDGHSLLVATGSTIAVFDTSSLRAVATWRMEDRVTGLGFSPDGLRLYVAMPEGIEMLDPRSGEQGAMIPMRWVLGIEAVGTQTVDP
jgi:DNA-binding beta-propeller fold protein YncE